MVVQEIAVLRSLSYDRNLVQFYGACLEREHAMLVLEYMEGGDLYQAIQENSYPTDTGLLSWYQKGSIIALDIAKGLVFLHQHEVTPCPKRCEVYSDRSPVGTTPLLMNCAQDSLTRCPIAAGSIGSRPQALCAFI